MTEDGIVLELLDRLCAESCARWVAVAFKGHDGQWRRCLRGRDQVLPQVESSFFRELEECGTGSTASPARWARFQSKWKAGWGIHRWFSPALDCPAYYCYLSSPQAGEASNQVAAWIELLLSAVVTAAVERARSRFELPRRQAVLESAISMLQASGEGELIPRWLGLALLITGADGAAYYEAAGPDFVPRHVRAEGALKASLEQMTAPLGELLQATATSREGTRRVHPEGRKPAAPSHPSSFRELIALPLQVEQAAAGVLAVARKEASDSGDMDLHLLLLFARQLGGMLENMRLVDRLQTANRELSAAQARLVESVRLQALGEVAAGVAHDVNNVLGALLGRIQLLQYSLSDSVALTGLGKMEALIGDGEAIVRRLQEAARIDTEAESSRKSLDHLAREVFINTEYALKQQSQIHDRKQVWITDFKPAGPVWGAAGRLEGALRQLLMELPGRVAPDARFHLQTGVDGDTTWFSIRIQSHPGASAADLERMSTVALLRSIVEPMGGALDLAEEPLALLLRLRFDVLERQESGAKASRGHSYRVLVVDDDDAVREVLEELLRTDGHEVTAARDGGEALRLCESVAFDLVLTDLGMPGISGWEVAELIKRGSPDLPVVMITGWGAQVDPERLKQSGVDRVLAKPFQWPAVLDTIHGLLGSRRA